jgi:Cystathionine beta-lyase family protein involved in aluminum resistance
VFAEVVGAEAAAVRVQFVSGTHAIACALFGILRPGDEMLAVAGSPYDTLEEVIGLRGQGQGSLMEFGILYRELPLTREGSVDWLALSSAISEKLAWFLSSALAVMLGGLVCLFLRLKNRRDSQTSES